MAGSGLVCFDAAAALGTNNPAGVDGQESFYEHVHFNFDGNYRLGRAWAGEIEPLLPEAIRARPTGDWAPQDVCERRLGLTDWNRELVLQAVEERLHRPPMSGQSNNDRRLAALHAQDKELRARMNRTTEAKARADFAAALAASPGDHWLHENFANFLETCGDLKPELAQWQQVRDLLPFHYFAWYRIGRLLEQQGQWVDAEASLLRAVALRARLSEGWFELGNVHLAQDKLAVALDDYERARQFDPQNGTYCAFTGKVLAKLNRRSEADQRYRQALQLQPDLWEVHFALAEDFAGANQLADAESEYEATIRLQPGYAPAHLAAGAMLARLGRFDDALDQFRETLRLEPNNQQARENLQRVEEWKKTPKAQ
jgi:tetratricopeptide (TPR) repeat protein